MARSQQYESRAAVSGVGGRIVAGAIAGIGGGIVFGVIMGMMGMLPMIAQLVGASDPVTGALVHLVISAIIGGGYGLVFGTIGASVSVGWLTGIIYGFAWWILGPLLIMPTLMGMGPQFAMALSGMMLMSLAGHLIYGVITGVLYPRVLKRQS